MSNQKQVDRARAEFEVQREAETGEPSPPDTGKKQAEAEHDARVDYKADGEPFGKLDKRDH